MVQYYASESIDSLLYHGTLKSVDILELETLGIEIQLSNPHSFTIVTCRFELDFLPSPRCQRQMIFEFNFPRSVISGHIPSHSHSHQLLGVFGRKFPFFCYLFEWACLHLLDPQITPTLPTHGSVTLDLDPCILTSEPLQHLFYCFYFLLQP